MTLSQHGTIVIGAGVAGWLLNPLGPLSVTPSYFPRARLNADQAPSLDPAPYAAQRFG